MITKNLIKQSKKGDEQAFLQIYQYLSKPVFAFILARTGNREDAKDILQDVFVDIWKGLSKFLFISEKKFYSFVFLITKRKIAQYYKNKKHNVELKEENLSNIVEIDYENRAHELLIDITHLPEKDQQIIQLRFMADLNFSDIGKMLKISENAAKVRCHRAIKKLRKFIDGKYESR